MMFKSYKREGKWIFSLVLAVAIVLSSMAGIPLHTAKDAQAAQGYEWGPINFDEEELTDGNKTVNNRGIQAYDKENTTMAIVADSLHITATSGNYKTINIFTGLAVGGDDYYWSNGFKPTKNKEYTVTFEAAVASGSGQVRIRGNSKTSKEEDWITTNLNAMTASEGKEAGFTKVIYTYTQEENGGNLQIDTGATETDVALILKNLMITEVVAESGGAVDGDGKLSVPIPIQISAFTPSNALNGMDGSFVNGTVTYGASGHANAYIYTAIPSIPDNYPNLHSLTFSYQGLDRVPDPDNSSALGGNVRLLAVNSSQATGGWMGDDAFVDARTIGQVSITGAAEKPVVATIIVDKEKLASLGNVARLVLYVHSGSKTNNSPTTFTYSDISVVFAADCCDGTCSPCECEDFCKFVAEGECCYVAPPTPAEADCIKIDIANLGAVGATLNGGEVTLTAQYGSNFMYFDVTLPEGNTIYDYEGLSLSFKGISGDNAYKTLGLSAGVPITPAGTFASYKSIANGVSNGLGGSTGTGSLTFNFNDSSLQELYNADIPVVRFAINMPAAVSSNVGGNVTVAGPTVFEISNIKLNSKSCDENNSCAICYVPPLPGDNYKATGSTGRHAPTKYGYDYEIWSQRLGNPPIAPGAATMNIPPAESQKGKGGIFNATWKDTHNVLIRAGKKFTDSKGIKIGTDSTLGDSYKEIGEIALEFETDWETTDNVAYLGVYGWAFYEPGSEPTRQEDGTPREFSNEIEYYIIQDRKSYNPVASATLRGSATIDGILYDFYVTDRIGQPMLNSDSGNFKQYWSVPRDAGNFRQSGTVSITKHYEEWEKAGMLMNGPLYEASWKVESYTGSSSGANGHAYVTKNILTIDGVEIYEPDEPSSGGGSDSPGTSSGGGSSTTPDTGITIEKQPNMPATVKKNITGAVKDNTLSFSITEAMVKDAVAAVTNKADGIAVRFNLTGTGYGNISGTFNRAALEALKTAGVKYTQFTSAVLDLTLDLKTIEEALGQTTGNVTVSAVTQDKLSDAAKALIGNRPVFDITIIGANGAIVSDLKGGAATIGIPYKPSLTEKTDNLYAVYVDKNGTPQLLDSSYDNGQVIFSRNSLSVYGVSYKAPAPAFTDTTTHWAKNDIDFVASRDLISSTTATTFSPDTAISRADFLMALGKLSGADVSGYKTSSFTDVKVTDTAMPYIEWAVKNEIVQGIGNNQFGPDIKIRRQDMAVMMTNYAKATGYTLPVSRQTITFADNAKISSYAKDAVKAIQQAGIIAGKGNNLFDPQGNATRAEASIILRSFVELVIDKGTARGWVQNDAGQWQYINTYGKATTGWLTTPEGDKYWFGDQGNMAAGKWVQSGSKWYYFDTSGKLAVNTTIDGYEVGADGARK